MMPVNSTVFAKNFEPEARNLIFMLDNSQAKKIFSDIFQECGGHYMEFPDDHWFVQSPKKYIGRWIEAYNQDWQSFIEALLQNSVNWAREESIYYIANDETIFSCSWDSFLKWWDGFLAGEDEGTFLVRANDRKEIFFFTPRGDIYLSRL